MQPKIEIIDNEKWLDGDFEVITSDGTRFRVPSYQLFAASAHVCALFRDARRFKTQSKTPDIKYSVTLVDPDFETSIVFETFMARVTDVVVDALPSSFKGTYGDYHLYSNLIRFLTKWECTGPLRILHHNFTLGAPKNDAVALAVFVIGASTDNHGLCRTAMVKADASNTNWKPSRFPGWVWVHCPPPYLAALVQSWVGSVEGNVNWKRSCGSLDVAFNELIVTTKKVDWSS